LELTHTRRPWFQPPTSNTDYDSASPRIEILIREIVAIRLGIIARFFGDKHHTSGITDQPCELFSVGGHSVLRILFMVRSLEVEDLRVVKACRCDLCDAGDITMMSKAQGAKGRNLREDHGN
jgi:hypothetical protein